MALTKTNAFCDEECTCKCGNKHTLYGGEGYTTTHIEGTVKRYIHIVRCNKCGAISEFKDIK